MSEIRAYDIDYDTDGASLDLPTELFFPADRFKDPASEIADAISDDVGWCVNNFSWERVEPSPKP